MNIETALEVQQEPLIKDKYNYLIAIAITFCSFLFYQYDHTWVNASSSGDLFFVNYLILIGLVVYASAVKGIKVWVLQNKVKSRYSFAGPILVSALISCFALNQQLPIFYESCSWLSIVLVASCINLMALPFLNYLPKVLQFLSYIISGISSILFLYFSCMMIPYYVIGAVGIIALGIGIHAFIPLIIFLKHVFFLSKHYDQHKRMVQLSITTSILVLILSSAYAVIWSKQVNELNDQKMRQVLQAPSLVPEWVNVAQHMKTNYLNKQIVLANLLYISPSDFFRGDFFSLPNQNLNAEKFHDPLIMYASCYADPLNYSDEEKIKILESSYDQRDLSENRLWTGKDLHTSSIVTNVRIYPAQRMAYTEKTLTIQNTDRNNFSTQEAIYSFYLPEGSVISSLSLWINGKEEQAVLTSKKKADSAYNTIVGVENRDPSVVHWQEGNRVSVRVFPCNVDEARQFKIGISSPLTLDENKLIYSNVPFKGPSVQGCKEIIQLQLVDEVQHIQVPNSFKLQQNIYQAEGNYAADWSVTFDASPFKTSSFQFDHQKYVISPINKTNEAFAPSSVYIDVNKSWSQEEWNSILSAIKGKPIYVYLNKLVEVNPQNQASLFSQLKEYNFSMFPFFLLKDPQHSLVISKSTTISPNLTELKGSDFQHNLNDFCINNKGIKVLHIGNVLSPYLRSLKEFRALQIECGSLATVESLIQSHTFPKNEESESNLVIPSAGIQISSSENNVADSSLSKAPDHVYRLFAYNKILQTMNFHAWMKDSIDKNLIDLATNANIVTPLSSLIVLETEEDYKRFNIEKNKEGLGNASMHNAGAVPEPEEWALMLMVAIALLILWKKHKSFKLA